MKVTPKKYLGQHFLKDMAIAQDIAEILTQTQLPVLEIGPGTGVLTQFLIQRQLQLHLIEIDKESIEYLQQHFKPEDFILHEGNLLKTDLMAITNTQPCAWVGNLPYNISSQIFFKMWEFKDYVQEGVFMIQKEVAQRIASKHNSKEYGILSVLLQLYYDITYKFTVPPHVFIPPPKVYSGVIHLCRKAETLVFDEKKLLTLVKTGFNQRRKTLRNSLKTLFTHPIDLELYGRNVLELRPEQLAPQDFVTLMQYY